MIVREIVNTNMDHPIAELTRLIGNLRNIHNRMHVPLQARDIAVTAGGL